MTTKQALPNDVKHLQQDTVPDASAPTAVIPAGATLELLELDRVRPNPNQPRKFFAQKELDDLAASIRAIGLVQPIVVRPAVLQTYTIVAGERRYRAFQLLAAEDHRFARIPAVIQDRSDRDMAVAALVENVVREDLNPIERAAALRELKTVLKTTWEGVADHVGLSVRQVHFLTGMLKLRKDFRDAVGTGTLTEKHARALGRLAKHPQASFRLFEYLTANPTLTGDDAMRLAAVMLRDPGTSPAAAAQLLADEALRKSLGAKPIPPIRADKPPVPDPSSAMQTVRAATTFAHASSQLQVHINQLAQDERTALRVAAAQAVQAAAALLTALDAPGPEL